MAQRESVLILVIIDGCVQGAKGWTRLREVDMSSLCCYELLNSLFDFWMGPFLGFF